MAQPPIETFDVGQVEVAIYAIEKEGKWGEYTQYQAHIRKRYLDKKANEWKDSNWYYGLRELNHVRLAAEEAERRILVLSGKRGWGGEEKSEGDEYDVEPPEDRGLTFDAERAKRFVQWATEEFELTEDTAVDMILENLGPLRDWTASEQAAKNRLRVSQGKKPETTGAF